MIKKLGIACFLLLGIAIIVTGVIREEWKLAGLGIGVILLGVGIIVLASTVFKKQMDTKAIIGTDPALEAIKATIASGKLSTRQEILDAQIRLLCRMGDAAGAMRLANRAATVAEKMHGKGNIELIRVLAAIGMSLANAEQYAEAEPFYTRASLLMEFADDPDPREAARLLRQLAEVRLRLRQFDRAEESCRNLVGVMEKAVGANSPQLAAIYEDLAELVRRAGGPKPRVVAMKRMAQDIRAGSGGAGAAA